MKSLHTKYIYRINYFFDKKKLEFKIILYFFLKKINFDNKVNCIL